MNDQNSLADVDSPEHLLARLFDIYGVLRRFKFVRLKVRNSYLYRLVLPLPYRQAASAAIPAARRITHIRLDIFIYGEDIPGETWVKHTQASLSVRYGWPTTKLRRNRIEQSFTVVPDGAQEQSLIFGNDSDLRHFERKMEYLIGKLTRGRVEHDMLRVLVSDLSANPELSFVARMRGSAAAKLWPVEAAHLTARDRIEGELVELLRMSLESEASKSAHWSCEASPDAFIEPASSRFVDPHRARSQRRLALNIWNASRLAQRRTV